MLSLSAGGRSGVVEAFNSTSRYLDDLLNIDGTFFDSKVGRVCPSGLRLSSAGVSNSGPRFWISICLCRVVLLGLRFLIVGMTLVLI